MQDYLDWQSNLSLDDVFADSAQFSYPCLHGDDLFYLINLPDEKGRTVLERKIGNDIQRVTPEGFSLRTKINEYGGKPFWLFDQCIVFVNQADQCLYSQRFDAQDISAPKRRSPLPKQGTTFMYSDVHLLTSGNFLCVLEVAEEQLGHANNRCVVAIIDGQKPDAEPIIVEQGADFYCNLVYHAATERLAWVQWNHPHMPWDENVLQTARLNNDYSLSDRQTAVADKNQTGVSHCQLAFSRNGRLFFSADFAEASAAADYWNVFVLNEDASATRLTSELLEFGYPHWQYGDHRIVACADQMLAIASAPSGDVLYLLQENGDCRPVYQVDGTIQSLATNERGDLVFIECGCTTPPKIRHLNSADILSQNTTDDGTFKIETLKQGGQYGYPVSKAMSIEFPCRDGQTAHGFFYAPVSHQNPTAVTEGMPPLIVMVHGGPTARAYSHFDLQKQYWLSNGFAIFDVNPRGSTGFGRRYRDALYGEWGNLDISDVIDGIRYLIDEKMIDGNRVCIRGKSSGGYAVLRALTEYPTVFKVGTSYYGIGNLATLAEVTHKFEKHYTDRLIGETYQADIASHSDSEYFKRSPINKIDRIQSAMLVLQGGEDFIVPPAVAHEVVQQLESNQVMHEYREYPNEGHGFRQRESNIDAWQRELTFYRTVLHKKALQKS